MADKIVVLVTCGSFSEGRKIARELVEARLAACVNLLESPVRSLYRWKGEMESSSEYLLLIKSRMGLFRSIRKKVQDLHSYEVPEIIALPILQGSRAYLSWIKANTRSVAKSAKTRARKTPRGK